MNFWRQGFRKLSSDRQTDRHDRNYIPRRFAGGQLINKASDCDALQLHEAARGHASPLTFHYDVHTKLEVNQPIRFWLITFYCWYVTFRGDLDLAHLTLNVCTGSAAAVTRSNSVPIFSKMVYSAAELGL